MFYIYLALAVWFFLADMLAGYIAGSPARPLGGAVLALLWPLSLAFSLVASAAIIRRIKDSPNG